MSVAIQLLQIMVWALFGASVMGAVAIAWEWWRDRWIRRSRIPRQYRGLPRPPLSNDQRIREYERNQRAYGGFR